jgi:hypothetical protein
MRHHELTKCGGGWDAIEVVSVRNVDDFRDGTCDGIFHPVSSTGQVCFAVSDPAVSTSCLSGLSWHVGLDRCVVVTL